MIQISIQFCYARNSARALSLSSIWQTVSAATTRLSARPRQCRQMPGIGDLPVRATSRMASRMTRVASDRLMVCLNRINDKVKFVTREYTADF